MMFQKIVFQTKILQNFSSILRKTFFLEAEYFCSIYFDTIVYGVMISEQNIFHNFVCFIKGSGELFNHSFDYVQSFRFLWSNNGSVP